MVVIYKQDATYIRESADAAEDSLCLVYGDKLGKRAYNAINRARVGTSYRKNGGPLVQVVDAEKGRVSWH